MYSKCYLNLQSSLILALLKIAIFWFRDCSTGPLGQAPGAHDPIRETIFSNRSLITPPSMRCMGSKKNPDTMGKSVVCLPVFASSKQLNFLR